MTEKEKQRTRIERLTKSYERKHGKVKTLPLQPAVFRELPLEIRQKAALEAHFIK